MKKILIILTIFIMCDGYVMAIDEDKDGIDDEKEEILAQKYAPILYFEKKEKLFPVAIQYHLSNSNLNQSTGDGNLLIDASPSIQEISLYTEPDKNYYLDNRKGGINNTGIIEDYQEKLSTLGYTVYCHIIPDGNATVIQHWMFYAFNEGPLNTHEGDWEMVQIILNSYDEPVEAMFSQHISGQKAKWEQVEKEGEHVKVYVARGSHANYFRPYQGKLGFANDIVGKNGKVLKPEDYILILLGEEKNHSSEQAWINFAGRWGDFGSYEDELRGKRGPYGPAYRENGEMWHSPIEWGESLPPLINEILILEWFLYNFVTIFVIFSVISFLVILLFMYRRYKLKGLGPRLSSLFYIDGVNMKSMGNILCIASIIIAVLSLFFPWYTVFGDIQIGEYKTPGMVKLIEIDGLNGLQVNLLEANSGIIQLVALPIPFSLIIGMGILFFILGTVGIEKSRKAGKKYILRGLKFLIPVILIILVIISFATFALQFFSNIEVPQDMKGVLSEISSSPISNEKVLTLPEYGTIYLKWGIGLGSIFLLTAGILSIIAGVFEIFTNQSFFENRKNIA